MEGGNPITTNEIDKIKSRGFQIEHTGNKKPAEFINDYFPGLHLFNFINELDQLLVSAAEGRLEKYISMNDSDPPILLIDFNSTETDDTEHDLVFQRAFIRYPNELVVEHEYFNLPINARRQGLSKKVTICCLKQYINMGVDKIKIHATLQDGGYVWAKFGFKAIVKSDVTTILKKQNMN